MIDRHSQIKSAPTLPGVYQFKNKNDKVIYIGKAKNLKNRLRSYFQKQKNQSSKTISMMKNASDLEWIVVENEVEALLTEANLIKKYRPKYNVLMKDDKSYPYIQITKEPFPQVLLTRTIKKDGSKYYGPFTDSKRLSTILKVMHKIFPIRSCSYFIDKNIINEKKISLCLDYHIKRLEKLILNSFKSLHRKKDFIKSIKIDTIEFDLKISDNKNKEIDTESLSAGERQLLAVAILWGLAKASNSAAPTIIDTPLGRLDSEHRLNLVEQYFPTASKQVILLSTDEEINKKYHKYISPHLSRSYKIEYDEKLNGSKLSEGYFF